MNHDDEYFNAGRRAFLEGLLAKRTIYDTVYFRDLWEDKARENIARELEEMNHG